jgi:hypothetical protein
MIKEKSKHIYQEFSNSYQKSKTDTVDPESNPGPVFNKRKRAFNGRSQNPLFPKCAGTIYRLPGPDASAKDNITVVIAKSPFE